MSPTYAAKTAVNWRASRDEIERTLSRYGASQFMTGWSDGGAMVAFSARGRQFRFVLPLPDRRERQFTHTPERDLERTPLQAEQAYEQGIRQRWRALALIIKAKLEAVEAGVSDFESEFLAHTILPSGRTVAEETLPSITRMYQGGEVRPLLEVTTGGQS
ncbi:MAG: hypothetical protein HY829_10590 [Actinobacteria bacterium]|nr:hypothetical protein [Actinomycetota bacterium]